MSRCSCTLCVCVSESVDDDSDDDSVEYDDDGRCANVVNDSLSVNHDDVVDSPRVAAIKRMSCDHAHQLTVYDNNECVNEAGSPSQQPRFTTVE